MATGGLWLKGANGVNCLNKGNGVTRIHIKRYACCLIVLCFLSICFMGCTENIRTFSVRYDDIVSTVSVTGKVYSAKTIAMSESYPVQFSKVSVSRGEVVKAGDLLAVFDQEYVSAKIDESLAAIAAATDQLSRLEYTGSSVCTMYAPTDGTVKSIQIMPKFDLDGRSNKLAPVMLISTRDEMFFWIECCGINRGDSIDVLINEEIINGIVDEVADGKARIVISSDRFPVGVEASVIINGYTTTGKLALSEYVPVLCENGQVQTVSVRENQEISRMSALFTVRKYPELVYNYLELVEIAQAEYNFYSGIMEKLEYCSDHNGVVEFVPTEGTVMQAGETIFSICAHDDTYISLSVDECDIGKVRVGQIVTLTSGTISNKQIECSITSVSQIGTESITQSNSWTTFEVIAKPNRETSLLVGSTVYGKIEVDAAEQVLIIPLIALHHTEDLLTQYVLANIDETSPYYAKAGNGLPNNAIAIKTGIQDGKYIEVSYGLEAGIDIFIDN